MSKSLYQTLNVSESASLDEIKKAYRKLARQYHPDINKSPGAEDKFKEINAAYEILSDPKKKAEYNRYGDSVFSGQSFQDFSRSHGSAGFDDLLNEIFGKKGGYNNSEGGWFGSSFFGFGNNDVKSDLDIHANITISLKSALNGDTVSLNLHNDYFNLKIPRGITDGSKLRAKGKGKRFGNSRGDAIITLSIAKEKGFEIDDINVIQDVDIPLKLMIFGGKFDIETIQKSPLSIKIPANMQNGQKVRIENMGFVDKNTGKTGDLLLRLNVVLPKQSELSPQLKEIMEREL